MPFGVILLYLAMTPSATRRLVPFLIVFAACLARNVSAQDSIRVDALRTVPEEEFFERIDDEEASADVAEMLSWLHEHPIDLNGAQRDELLSIPGLTGENADAILNLREAEERLASVEDLRNIPGGEEILARVRRYVFVQQSFPVPAAGRIPVVELSERFSSFLPETAPSVDPESEGNPAKSLSRLSLRVSKQVRGSLLFEKDAGERTRDGFLSACISYHGNGVIEQAVLGDFSADLGQGLVLWRRNDTGRSGDLVSGICRPGARLLPYRLTDEVHYLRGGAVALQSNAWKVPVRCLLLVSRTSLAASMNEQGEVTSFYTSGLYRTAAELRKRNSVRELLGGTRLECGSRGKASLGLSYYRSSFDRTIKPVTAFGFSGEWSEVLGGDFNIYTGKTSLFGEFARTANGGTAGIAGIMTALDSTLRASIAYRDYSGRFNNPHASAYGVQTTSTNERGITLGWYIQCSRVFTLSGYADQCKIPGSTYGSLLPRMASDFLVEATTVPLPELRLSLVVRARKSETMQENAQGDQDRNSARMSFRLKISSHLEMKARMEHGVSRFAGAHRVEKGDIISQTLCCRINWFEGEYGAAFFATDSYDARLYDYEGNLHGCVPSPALYGRGSRWHILVAWSSTPWIRFAAKYAVTLREKSPIARDLGVQVELRF